MIYTYKTHGTCASQIELEIEGDIVKKVSFTNGCNGNTQGIARLVEGMSLEEIREKLEGIQCKGKPTSCPDQLAKAAEEALKAQG